MIKQRVDEKARELSPGFVVDSLKLPAQVRWKALYIRIVKSPLDKEELLEKTFPLVRQAALERITKLREINPPDCILIPEEEKFKKVDTYESYLKYHPIAKAIVKLKTLAV